MRTPASPDVDVRAGGRQRRMSSCCTPFTAQMNRPCRAVSLVAVATLVSAAAALQLQQRNEHIRLHPSRCLLASCCVQTASTCIAMLFLMRSLNTLQAALDSTANASDFQHRPSAAGSRSSTFVRSCCRQKSPNLHFCRNFFYGCNARSGR